MKINITQYNENGRFAYNFDIPETDKTRKYYLTGLPDDITLFTLKCNYKYHATRKSGLFAQHLITQSYTVYVVHDGVAYHLTDMPATINRKELGEAIMAVFDDCLNAEMIADTLEINEIDTYMCKTEEEFFNMLEGE
jgi:hypothetical protein